MAGKPFLPDHIRDYIASVSVRESDLMRRLREETAPLPRASMQLEPAQAQFLALLAQLIGARRTIEIGVFTGYSALAVALGLPADGKIIACDIDEGYTAVARRYWKEAGVDHMIDLRLRPAMETLHELLQQKKHGWFDLVFIDADKSNYEGYYECALELLRPGGLIVIDNTLWSGRVTDPAEKDVDTLALKALNQKIFADSRVTMSMIPIGDGMTLAMKR